MANRSRCRGTRPAQTAPAVQPPLAPLAYPEPPVRRWSHPIEGVAASRENDPTLHYIYCALSYQNQLLADIKALLQQMAEDAAEQSEP